MFFVKQNGISFFIFLDKGIDLTSALKIPKKSGLHSQTGLVEYILN